MAEEIWCRKFFVAVSKQTDETLHLQTSSAPKQPLATVDMKTNAVQVYSVPKHHIYVL